MKTGMPPTVVIHFFALNPKSKSKLRFRNLLRKRGSSAYQRQGSGAKGKKFRFSAMGKFGVILARA
jgi:hypothetical protein